MSPDVKTYVLDVSFDGNDTYDGASLTYTEFSNNTGVEELVAELSFRYENWAEKKMAQQIKKIL